MKTVTKELWDYAELLTKDHEEIVRMIGMEIQYKIKIKWMLQEKEEIQEAYIAGLFPKERETPESFYQENYEKDNVL